MKWVLAGLLAAVVSQAPAPADACGRLLVINSPPPVAKVARSSNPSHLLVLGEAPHRLERELRQAGHDVEVEPQAASARRVDYRVVIVDLRDVDTARKLFPSAIVIGRSGNVQSDLVAIERSLARPVVAHANPPPTHVQPKRTPIDFGGGRTTPIAQGGGGGAITTTTPPPAIAAPAVPASTAPALHDEVYFGYASTKLNHKLDSTVKWLADHPSVNIVIEGYADPTGSHEANLALGQARAQSVRDYLVGNGIDAARIEVMSYGDTRLKYGKTDARNRRVAIEPKP